MVLDVRVSDRELTPDLQDDHRSGKIVVQLNGRINKCGVISPRFNVQLAQIESWVNLQIGRASCRERVS